jgi:hypothetical protein
MQTEGEDTRQTENMEKTEGKTKKETQSRVTE